MHAIINEVKNPGGVPHKGLYREDLPEGGTFFRLGIHKLKYMKGEENRLSI